MQIKDVGDHIFLRVTPNTSVGRAIRSQNLSKFIRPYQILRKIGPITYEITFHPQLSKLHNVFHVSQLRRYVPNLTHVLEVDEVQVKETLFVEA